jgi:hypothetical protein
VNFWSPTFEAPNAVEEGAQHLTGAAKVGQFQMARRIEQKVLHLQVPMHNALLMYVNQTTKEVRKLILDGAFHGAFHWVEQFQCQGARNLMQQFNYELALAQSQ